MMTQDPVQSEAPPVVAPAASPVDAGQMYYEVSLRDILRKLFRGLWIIVLTVTLGISTGVWWLKRTPLIYTATMVVGPPSGSAAGGGLAWASAQLQGLPFFSSLARFGGSSPSPTFARFVQLLTSVPVAERLQSKYGILQQVYSDSWDAEAQQWVAPNPGIRAKVKAYFGRPAWTPPTPATLAGFLDDAVRVSPIHVSGMREVSLTYHDPEFAARLLLWLFGEVDRMLREETLNRTRQRINYLQAKLEEVTIAEHRQVLVAIFSDQEKAMMLVNADDSFAADLIEPPVAPTQPSGPKPLPVLALVAVASVGLGMLLVFLKEAVIGGDKKK